MTCRVIFYSNINGSVLLIKLGKKIRGRCDFSTAGVDIYKYISVGAIDLKILVNYK